MKFHRLSMSKLGLSTKCLYGFRPDVATYDRPTGEPAAIGRVTHSLVERQINGTPMADDVDEELLKKATAIFNGPLQAFLASRKWTTCEEGYEYDSLTGESRKGPRRGEPGYGHVSTDVLYGTADLIAIEGDTAYVVDLKTGKPPADAEQLYGQAVAVTRKYGVPNASVAYARALKTKFELLDEEVLDADRLDYEAGRIRKRMRMLPMAEPVAGEWCWRCDVRPGCPAHEHDDGYVAPDAPEAAAYDEGRRLF